jgi:hypothetical protein
MRWTEGQDDVIRECCYRGAVYVADEIFRRFGVRRDPHAVEMRASRIGVSLAVRSTCPRCGAVGVRLRQSTGLCALCTTELFRDKAKAFNDLLEAERAEAEDPARLAAARREWDRLRKANSRLRRRYGLPSEAEREAGEGSAGG